MDALDQRENCTIPDCQEKDEDNGGNEEGDNVIKITFVVAYIIIIMFSLAGNSLVIHLVRTRRDIRQNPFNWLLANTAVADVLDVITASTFTLSFYLVGKRWIPGIVGTLLCKLIPFILNISISVAIWTLTVIAVDRFLAIVCIRRRPLSSRSVVRSVFGLWLCFCVIFSGQLYKFKTRQTEDGITVCYEGWHDFSKLIAYTLFKAEMVVKVIVTYAVPLIITAVLYSLIACFLWRHKPPGNVNQQAYARQAKKRRSVIKMLVTAVSVFTVCWLPVHVGHIMSMFHPSAYDAIPTVFRWFFFWLAHANGAIHPWLFIVFSEKLRVETKAMFRFIRHRPRKQDRFQLPELSTFSQQTLGIHSLEMRPSRHLQTSISSIGISTLSLDTRF